MKETPLTSKHIALAAKMTEFAGYNMPVLYTGITEEHLNVRESVGLFDVSHMGEFILKGKGALDLIQKVTSNDASKLERGQAQYSCLPNDKGGIVDDLLVYHLEDGHYMLVVNASNIEKDWNWINSHNKFDVELFDISDKTALMAIQGPKATQTLQPLTDVNLAELEYYTFTKGTLAGVGNVLISATGYTGAGGFEVYVENEHAPVIWDAILNSGKAHGITPIGLGARDTLRLEMGFCLYGNDIDDSTNPIEAGLGWITKLNKEDFIGKEFAQNLKDNGVNRRLRGLVLEERGIPRHDYEIGNADGEVIGHVTSGTQSPVLQKGIGMGYINTGYTKFGTEVFIHVRKKRIKATVTRPPFIES